MVSRAEEAEVEVKKLKTKVGGSHVTTGQQEAQSWLGARFPAGPWLHPVLSVPPQNEQLLEDVEFYRYELNNNDTSTKEKFQKKLSAANYHLERCLDDLQVPPVDPVQEWLMDHRGPKLGISLLDSF